MEGTEVRKLAALEDTHWWYRERRHLLARAIRGMRPGRALDVGAAGGGNTRVLRDAGWSAVALEYGADGAEVARGRGLHVLRADATRAAAGGRQPGPRRGLRRARAHPRRRRRGGRGPPRAAPRAGPSSWRCRPTPGCGRSTTWPSTTCAATRAVTLRRRAGAGRVRDRVDDVVERAAAPRRRAAPPHEHRAATSTSSTRSSTSGCGPSSPPSATCRSDGCPVCLCW